MPCSVGAQPARKASQRTDLYTPLLVTCPARCACFAVYKVYPAGSWFLPCNWWEKVCRRRIYQELAIGRMDLT